ncbi:respiratory-chain NADH dehydrogenase domain-containing protein [Stappia sp. 22II-S9-Z10]|nr:respiratory-chain NADH dehydrogenase domain-containing protein [Stappia sp. 22II-S9-Z10]
MRAILRPMPIRRDMLIEALHVVQDRIGYIHARHIAALAEIFRLAQAEVHAVASFYHHFDIVKEGQMPPAPLTVRICESLSCHMAGADALAEAMEAATDPGKVRIVKVPCIGRCDAAPAAQVARRAIDNATVESLTEALGGPRTPDIAAYETLDAYRAEGGYGTLAKILSGEISADDAIQTMSDAKLRGLGGAGFPAGRKWGFVRSYPGPRLMTINGDEGEPGTFKDRHWLERRPHLMLEGALIAAKIVEAERIYLYMRDEYQGVLEILRREIAALDRAGLTHVPIELRRGAGAYICGEESAMIESIEGKRGLPRHRPPYIAEVGLFGRPTLNHNIETLLWVPTILQDGAEAFAKMGWDEKHAGMRSFSVSGRVKEPGVKLAPAGIPLIRLIEDYCGGMAEGHTFKAFLPGGASGGIFPASMADLAMDFGTFEPHSGFIGSHAVVILSDADSIHDAALNTMRFFRHESCGQCTPCRSGTDKMVRLMEHGDLDHDLAADLMTVMRDSSICGLGQAASNCVAHLLQHFPEDVK